MLINTLETIAHEHEAKRLEVLQASLIYSNTFYAPFELSNASNVFALFSASNSCL